MKALLVAALIALSAPAQADVPPSYANGKQLLEGLRSADPRDQFTAAIYLAGAFDATWGALHCAPKPEPSALVELVRAELERVEASLPELLAETPAARFLVVPLNGAFPCGIPKGDKV